MAAYIYHARNKGSLLICSSDIKCQFSVIYTQKNSFIFIGIKELYLIVLRISIFIILLC